ncbi:hypothetical protein F5144DRAFT_236571 [Chaetomium tenue]|uniref:Uncharacterized protein n=1 Tax=Chaetomium tenue TaxID=1854479 RepID=A0ACB7P6Y1_9PEZI|nr:hypothetical protein F5144DRAFT_236571 [Chaetomium globosum]
MCHISTTSTERPKQAHPKATTRVALVMITLPSLPCPLSPALSPPVSPGPPVGVCRSRLQQTHTHPWPCHADCRMQDALLLPGRWTCTPVGGRKRLLKHWHPAQNVVLTGPAGVDVKPHACFVSVSRGPVGFGTRGCLSSAPPFSSRETSHACTGPNKDRTLYGHRRARRERRQGGATQPHSTHCSAEKITHRVASSSGGRDRFCGPWPLPIHEMPPFVKPCRRAQRINNNNKLPDFITLPIPHYPHHCAHRTARSGQAGPVREKTKSPN